MIVECEKMLSMSDVRRGDCRTTQEILGHSARLGIYGGEDLFGTAVVDVAQLAHLMPLETIIVVRSMYQDL